MHGQSWVATLFFALIAFGGGYLAGSRGPTPGQGSAIDAISPIGAETCFFSPGGGCTAAVVQQIASARHSIELLSFALTSPPIADALIAAHRRGVDVTLVLDAAATSDHRIQAQQLTAAGVPVYLDSHHAVVHSTFFLIDAQTLITGSFTLTPAAEDANVENVLILHDRPRLASAYEDNFRAHLSHAQAYDGK